ncbi:MAG: dihydroorotase [Candidatus Asgardarchaeia archaeon]
MGVIDLIIENTTIPTDAGLVIGSILIDEGKILKVKRTPLLVDADVRIDGNGLIALPGAVDVHVHFRDFDLAYKEDFYSGSCAAVAGGVTTVFDMPNTKPPVNNSYYLEQRISLGKMKSLTNFAFHVGYPDNDKNLEKELVDMYELGARSIKLYAYEHDNFSNVLEKIIEVVKKKGLRDFRFCIHAEDKAMIEKNEKTHESHIKDLEYHNLVRSEYAEAKVVSEVLNMVRKHKIPVHICHISSQLSINLLKEAKKEKLPISTEVTPHHVFLYLEKVKPMGPFAKTNPPIRPRETSLKLLDALINGPIDFISSDHAPHTYREKERGIDDIREAPSGVVGVETLLPLMFDLLSRDMITFSRFLEVVSYKQIETFKIKNKGGLTSGYDADLVLIDPKTEWTIKGENLHGRTKFTPFEGQKVKGLVKYTIVQGLLVYDNGDILIKNGVGEYIGEEW